MKKADTKTTESTDWPNTVRSRTELDSALEAGLASGVSEKTWDAVIEDARKKLDLE